MSDECREGLGKFGHPYEPYSIQLEFMRTLYDVLDLSQIGIFESPTGTGKSLSIICASMTWLRRNLFLGNGVQVDDEDSTDPEWMRQEEMAQYQLIQQAALKAMQTRIERTKADEKSPEGIHGSLRSRPHKRTKVREEFKSHSSSEELTLAEYHSDGESHGSISANPTSIFSSDVLKLLDHLGHPAISRPSDDVQNPLHTRKIFFCSRTHSQLAQFASELHKPALQPWRARKSGGSEKAAQTPRYVALASRKNLCLNSEVSHLPLEQLNEACIDLQDKRTPVARKCKYLSKDKTAEQQFRDHVLSSIRDVEDLAGLGRALGVCPYYATRSAVPEAEIVAMPYPLLLNKSARESLGIELKDSIVIVDEAHNLIDAITGLSAASVSLATLINSSKQLEVYLAKYGQRLAGKNKSYIDQLMRICKALILFLSSEVVNSKVTISQLLANGSDAVNIHKLSNYLRVSKLSRKVEAYVLIAKSDHSAEMKDEHNGSLAGLSSLERFLNCLANPAPEGRFFVENYDGQSPTVRYMLLDPSYAFSDIVREARSVVLAGGTMQPVDDIIELLFADDKSRIQTFSCGHIIPSDNLVALTVDSGPLNVQFDFRFSNKHDQSMLEDLGRLLLNLASLIPDGVVVFFSSYDYLDHVLQVFERLGQTKRLVAKKPIFVETKLASVDVILQQYTVSVDSGRGGLLFAVMGGKLSEGINFSDALGRAVLVVGVPFPNSKSQEWQSRLAFVKDSTVARLLRSGRSESEATTVGIKAAEEHLVNAAMRAVNQSIGRAIRHKNDYAMIFLLDVRYRQPGIRDKLPRWILENLDKPGVERFGEVVKQTVKFFRVARGS